MGTSMARLGDASSHGGTIITGAARSFVNGKPAARKGDLHSCPIHGHGVTPITTGSAGVMIEGQASARVGDATGCGAIIIGGSPDAEAG